MNKRLENLYMQYDDTLDDNGTVEVAGLQFYPSYILKNLDETAYRCGFLDYVDALGIDLDSLGDTE